MKQALDADDRPWQLYICIACGLIYNEEEGDPDGGLPPGTRFEDIPDDWECPDCGVTKKDFKPFVKRQFKVASSPKRLAGKGIVVVGAGMAGWAMVEAIRSRNPSSPITVITSCDGHRYNKPRLSVSFSQAEPDSEFHLQEDALQAAQRLGVTLIERTFVISVSSASKQVRTTRGTYPYTQLIIAQGSQTALPASLPEHLCWRINRLSDWNALNTKLGKRHHRIALVGAGMVGCELAEDLSRAGHTVFLLSRHDRPLNSLLPKKASSRLLDSVKKNGITFIPSANIQDVVKAQDSTKVLRWDDTEELEVDEIIATTGVVTANRIAKSSGLAFDNGIVVNPQTLSTSTNDIYAIGDCITLSGRTDRYIEPIEQQAAVVADAIATDSRGLKYQHNVSTVALKTKSLPIVMQGRPDTDATWEEIKSNDRFLLMEQRKNGDLIATLRVGTER